MCVCVCVCVCTCVCVCVCVCICVCLHVCLCVCVLYVRACLCLFKLQDICNHSQVTECFKEVSHRLFERPNSIEELTEQREYITTIPEKITENQVSQQMMLRD